MPELEDNHEGDPLDALAAIEEESGEQEGKLKKSPEAVLKEASLTGVFSTPEQNDPLKMLFTPGTVANNLLMRGNHADRRMVIAGCHILAQCDEFKDNISRLEVMAVMAGTCGIGGERARMLVDAYVGKEAGRQKRGLGEWIREKAGFGNDDKGSQ